LGDWAALAVPGKSVPSTVTGGGPWPGAGKAGVPRVTYGAQTLAGKAMRPPAAVLGRIGGQAAAAATSAPTPIAAPCTGKKKQRSDAPGAGRQLCDGEIDPCSGLVFIEEEHAALRSAPGAGSRSGASKGAGAQPLHTFRTRKQRDAMTAALYAEYNSRVFGHALPSGMQLEWNNRLTKTAGLTYSSRERCDAAGSSTTVGSAASGLGDAAAGGVGGSAKGMARPLCDAAASCAASSCFDEAFAGADAAGRKSVARVKGAHLYKARIVLSSKVVDTPLKLAQVRVQQGASRQHRHVLARHPLSLQRRCTCTFFGNPSPRVFQTFISSVRGPILADPAARDVPRRCLDRGSHQQAAARRHLPEVGCVCRAEGRPQQPTLPAFGRITCLLQCMRGVS